VALGSATQIGMFVVPLCVIVAWILGIKMDLNFHLLETGSLALAIITTGFTLQDGTSHYLKGLILLLLYIVIGACFFVQRTPSGEHNIEPQSIAADAASIAGAAHYIVAQIAVSDLYLKPWLPLL
ncbi:vacuolar cation/proton exchanger 3, partial [Trifolium medium]|nr:vacuolar cation/proton exchanger 3 [Trifolium medium]